MTVYTGKTLAITNLQIGAIKSMYGNLVGKLPVEVSVLMFGAYSKLGPKAAAGKSKFTTTLMAGSKLS